MCRRRQKNAENQKILRKHAEGIKKEKRAEKDRKGTNIMKETKLQ